MGKFIPSDEIASYIQKQVRSARKEIGLKQSDLADLIGVSRYAISSKELGKASFRAVELAIIAEATRKPIEWFYPDPSNLTQDQSHTSTIK